jgi:hypothetical protein
MTTPVSESQNKQIYRERVIPGIGAFLPLLLIPPTGYLTLTPINQALGIFIGVVGTIAAVLALLLSAPLIELNQSRLKIGKAEIPRNILGSAEVISPSEAFAERGPKLDARAFIRFQPTVKTLIKIDLTDPKDPTPYLLFSTRKPEVLAAILNGRESAL